MVESYRNGEGSSLELGHYKQYKIFEQNEWDNNIWVFGSLRKRLINLIIAVTAIQFI
jgi:hypothetical protein